MLLARVCPFFWAGLLVRQNLLGLAAVLLVRTLTLFPLFLPPSLLVCPVLSATLLLSASTTVIGVEHADMMFTTVYDFKGTGAPGHGKYFRRPSVSAVQQSCHTVVLGLRTRMVLRKRYPTDSGGGLLIYVAWGYHACGGKPVLKPEEFPEFWCP